MDPIIKRRYNATYRLRKSGFMVNTKRGEIPIYFRQVSHIIGNPNAIILIREYNYTIVENRQLELHI